MREGQQGKGLGGSKKGGRIRLGRIDGADRLGFDGSAGRISLGGFFEFQQFRGTVNLGSGKEVERFTVSRILVDQSGEGGNVGVASAFAASLSRRQSVQPRPQRSHALVNAGLPMAWSNAEDPACDVTEALKRGGGGPHIEHVGMQRKQSLEDVKIARLRAECAFPCRHCLLQCFRMRCTELIKSIAPFSGQRHILGMLGRGACEAGCRLGIFAFGQVCLARLTTCCSRRCAVIRYRMTSAVPINSSIDVKMMMNLRFTAPRRGPRGMFREVRPTIVLRSGRCQFSLRRETENIDPLTPALQLGGKAFVDFRHRGGEKITHDALRLLRVACRRHHFDFRVVGLALEDIHEALADFPVFRLVAAIDAETVRHITVRSCDGSESMRTSRTSRGWSPMVQRTVSAWAAEETPPAT